jgi:hypothetical protein
MNTTSKNNSFYPKINLALLIYSISFVFIVLFSVQVIYTWPTIWKRLAIATACLLPGFIVIKQQVPILLKREKLPEPVLFLIVIISLGILNVIFSENRWEAFKAMALFLMSGVMVFGLTFYILNSKQKQNLFFILCTACFAILTFFGIAEFIFTNSNSFNPVSLFYGNPLPAGAILILLSIGPLKLLFETKTNKEKGPLVVLLTLGIIVLILIGKKGPLVALAVMISVYVFYYFKNIWVLPLAFIFFLGLGYQFKDTFPKNSFPSKFINTMTDENSFLIRLEFYRTAYKILKEKPVFGVGFYAPLDKYFPHDYESTFKPLGQKGYFQNHITHTNTLDNLFLTLIARAGLLFSIPYFLFILYVINKLFVSLRKSVKERRDSISFIAVLSGFFVLRMTFDTLVFPPLNWTFHSILGVITKYHS